jgi:hypothetical protein
MWEFKPYVFLLKYGLETKKKPIEIGHINDNKKKRPE